MLTSFSKKMAFASLLTMSFALQTMPSLAMDGPPVKSCRKDQEDISALIDQYYNNPQELEDLLSCSSSSSDSSEDTSTDEDEHPMLAPLKAEAEKGNPKAKVLLCFAKLLDWRDVVELAEWPDVHAWLLDQPHEGSALQWLGIFANEQWEGHPRNIQIAEDYLLKAAAKGKTSVFSYLASMFHYFPDSIDRQDPLDPEKIQEYQGKAIEYYKKAAEAGDNSISKRVNSYYKNPDFFDGYCEDDELIKAFFQIEADQGNQKAQVLHLYAKFIWGDEGEEGENKSIDLPEWPAIATWLSQQTDDPFALMWLGAFAEQEWAGHPSDPEEADRYFLMAIQKGKTSICRTIASLTQDQAKAEKYHLIAADRGDKTAYQDLGSLFHYGANGQAPNFEKAEKYYLMAAEQEATVYIVLATMFHYGVNGQGTNFEKAEKYYLKAPQNGDTLVCQNLGNLYHRGVNGQGTNFEKAEKYHLMAAENGDSLACYNLGSLYHYGVNGQFVDLDKAVQWYTKCVQTKGLNANIAADSLGQLYQMGWKDHPAEPTKAVYYFTRALQEKGFYREEGVKTDLKNLCIPSEPMEENIVNVLSLEKDTSETEKNWQTSLSYLQSIGDKMGWKFDVENMSLEFNPNCPELVKSLTQTHPGVWNGKQEDYETYMTLFLNLSNLLPKALEENAFCFMTPKAAVQDHLLKTFPKCNLLDVKQTDEMGLCLFELGTTPYLAFGHESVTLAHGIMSMLEGQDSLISRVTRHQVKVSILEKLKTQLKSKLGEDSSLFLNVILKKPTRLVGYQGQVSTPSFRESLLETLMTNPEIKKEQALQHINKYVEKKTQGVVTNVIDLCIDEAITAHIDSKITKRRKKIQCLTEAVENFKAILTVAHPKKAAFFKKEYDFLGDMFE